MTRAIALVLFLVAAPAAADSTTNARPAKAPAAAAAKPAACKKLVVGRGLERRVVCAIETKIDVSVAPPKPNVVIVHQSPRQVVGRPKSENRLNGLSQRRN
jgi:hypothetical protein